MELGIIFAPLCFFESLIFSQNILFVQQMHIKFPRHQKVKSPGGKEEQRYRGSTDPPAEQKMWHFTKLKVILTFSN